MPVDEIKQAAYEDLVSRGYFKQNPDKQVFADDLIARGVLRRVGGSPAAPKPVTASNGKAVSNAELGNLLSRYNAGNTPSSGLGDLRAYEGKEKAKEGDQAPRRAQELLAGARGLGTSVMDLIGQPSLTAEAILRRTMNPGTADAEMLQSVKEREAMLNKMAGPGGQSYRKGAIASVPAVAALDPVARTGAVIGERIGERGGPVGAAVGGIVGGVGATLIPGLAEGINNASNYLDKIRLGAPAADFLQGGTAQAQQSDPHGFEAGSIAPMAMFQRPGLGMDKQAMIGRGIGAGVGAGTALATGQGDPLIQGAAGALFSGHDTPLGALNSRIANKVADKAHIALTPNARTSTYGYKDDSTGDDYTRAKMGAWGNQLRKPDAQGNGGSIALTPDLAAQMREQGHGPGSLIQVRAKGKDGKERLITGYWDDKVPGEYKGKPLRGRVDLYLPEGHNPALDDLRVVEITPNNGRPIQTKKSAQQFNRTLSGLPRTDFGSLYPHEYEQGAPPTADTPPAPDFLGLPQGREPLGLPSYPGTEIGPDGVFYGRGAVDSTPPPEPLGLPSYPRTFFSGENGIDTGIGSPSGPYRGNAVQDALAPPAKPLAPSVEEMAAAPAAPKKSRRPAPKPAVQEEAPKPQVETAPEPAPEAPKPVTEAPAEQPANAPHKAGDKVLVKLRSNSKEPVEGTVSGVTHNLHTGKPVYSVKLPDDARGMPRTVVLTEGDQRLVGKAAPKPEPLTAPSPAAEPPKPTLKPEAPAPTDSNSPAMADLSKWIKEPIISGAPPEQKAAILANRLRTNHPSIPPDSRANILEAFLRGQEAPQPNPTQGPSAPKPAAKPKPDPATFKKGDAIRVKVGTNRDGGEALREVLVLRRRRDGKYEVESVGLKGSAAVFTVSPEDVRGFIERKVHNTAAQKPVKTKVESGDHSISITDEGVSVTRKGEPVSITNQSESLIRKIAAKNGSDEAIAAIAKSQGSSHSEGTLVRVPAEGSTPDNIIWTYGVRGKNPRGGGRTRPISVDQPEWVKEVWAETNNKGDLPKPLDVIHNNEMTPIGEPSPRNKSEAGKAWAERNAPAKPKEEVKAPPVEKEKGIADFKHSDKNTKVVTMPDGQKTPIKMGAEVKVRFYRHPRPGKGPAFGADHVEVPLKVVTVNKDSNAVTLRVSEDTVFRQNHADKTKDIVLPKGAEFTMLIPERKTANPDSPYVPLKDLPPGTLTLEDIIHLQTRATESKQYSGRSKKVIDGSLLESRPRQESPRDRIMNEAASAVKKSGERGC